MIRDRFHGQLTVVGVSGGNRMYVAYHTDPIGTPGKEVGPSPHLKASKRYRLSLHTVICAVHS